MEELEDVEPSARELRTSTASHLETLWLRRQLEEAAEEVDQANKERDEALQRLTEVQAQHRQRRLQSADSFKLSRADSTLTDRGKKPARRRLSSDGKEDFDNDGGLNFALQREEILLSEIRQEQAQKRELL
eukprot:TRINITY_DN35025_c0_g1_i1.p1 TRINITY_DN35025_c0_g1~~TRINITY_DN35025_c0_g1_i1.p1  ORF type:complete len:131 (+),score=37.67 TRINITY_DN35025_c0_g1_i1:311-703(+)